MTIEVLLAVLAFGTMSAVIAFALWSKARTERRRDNPDAPKSTLAADAPNSR